jgi:hypothetical protein
VAEADLEVFDQSQAFLHWEPMDTQPPYDIREIVDVEAV